jgi:hypothetical protein
LSSTIGWILSSTAGTGCRLSGIRRLRHELFGNPVKIDINRTDGSTTATSDAGILTAQIAEAQAFMLHPETQPRGATGPEIEAPGHPAMFGKEAVVPDPFSAYRAICASHINQVETVTGRANS